MPTDPYAAEARETERAVLMARMSHIIDHHNRQKGRPHLLRVRCGKLVEELGEVEEVLVELEESNPRKPPARSSEEALAHLTRELLDVAVTALGAVEHITGNAGLSPSLLDSHIRAVASRMGADR